MFQVQIPHTGNSNQSRNGDRSELTSVKVKSHREGIERIRIRSRRRIRPRAKIMMIMLGVEVLPWHL